MRVRVAVAILGVGLVLGGAVAAFQHSRRMPGESFAGPPPVPSREEVALASQVRTDVSTLVDDIGERHERRYGALLEARDFIERRLREQGLTPRRHTYEVVRLPFHNVYADIGDTTRPYLLIGAHYDSAPGSPGGNDNASGVAALLALAGRLADEPPAVAVRLAFFTNEEPPHFATATMGSRVFASWLEARGELPEGAIVLDSVGFYTQAPNSQRYASAAMAWRFGDTGRFLAFVSDHLSEPLMRRVLGPFRRSARLATEGAVVSRGSFGAAWSDHASFWRHDVPAILLTDTAAFRDAHYHTTHDDGSQVDPVAVARVVAGIERALRAPP